MKTIQRQVWKQMANIVEWEMPTKTCNIFWSRFQIFLQDIFVLETNNRLFSPNLKQDLTAGTLLVLQNQFDYVFGLHTFSTWCGC